VQIPDRLTASSSTDCGDFTIPLINATSLSPPHPTWKGAGEITCQREPGQACIPHPFEVVLHCQGFQLFYLQVFSGGSGQETGQILSLDCDPLTIVAEFTPTLYCTHPYFITIT
jgi:hypothetical protein